MAEKPKMLGVSLSGPGSRVPDDVKMYYVTRACELLAQGRPITDLAMTEDHAPTPRTIRKWIEDAPFTLGKEYAESIAAYSDCLVDQMLIIADDPNLTPADKIVRIKARQWIAARLAPDKYGDNKRVEITQKIQTLDDNALALRIESLSRILKDPHIKKPAISSGLEYLDKSGAIDGLCVKAQVDVLSSTSAPEIKNAQVVALDLADFTIDETDLCN